MILKYGTEVKHSTVPNIYPYDRYLTVLNGSYTSFSSTMAVVLNIPTAPFIRNVEFKANQTLYKTNLSWKEILLLLGFCNPDYRKTMHG